MISFTKLLISFCLLLFLMVIPGSVSAAEYFTTSYKVTYTVSESGTTRAVMQVSLKNTSSQYYASSYKIKVGFGNIENVTASDPEGSLNPVVTKTDDGTLIEAEFNKQVVGEGNVLTYVISFDTPDIAKKDGSIWEINIPGLENDSEFNSFVAEVKVPESFGKPTYIKPAQASTTTVFTKEQLGKSGISIAYGEEQVYSFNLFYHLKNSNLFPVRTEIALPPSTNYQEVYIEYLTPKPTNVALDEDGNWIAQYRLAPSQRINVQARGYASLSLTPKKEQLTKAELKPYLAEKPFWETNRKEIKELAAQLKTPRAMYDYLVTNLTYDFSRVEENKPRIGAFGALQQKNSAVCLEFTDLFIALARSAGIPAREVDGYANTENSKQRPLSLVKDILHAWPEYYDEEKQTWVMIDPTWGNTTGGVDYFDVLDFDHFAFVVRGVDSEYPIPAGGYKYEEDENLKDVNITFPRTFTPPPMSVSVAVDEEQKHYSVLPLTTTVTVTNTGQGLITPQKVVVRSRTLKPSLQAKNLPAIPPFGHVDVPLAYDGLPFLTNRSFPLTMTIAEQTQSLVVTVVPLIFSIYAAVGGIIIAIFATIIFIIAKKARSVPVSPK